jgi:hypothetical protein
VISEISKALIAAIDGSKLLTNRHRRVVVPRMEVMEQEDILIEDVSNQKWSEIERECDEDRLSDGRNLTALSIPSRHSTESVFSGLSLTDMLWVPLAIQLE